MVALASSVLKPDDRRSLFTFSDGAVTRFSSALWSATFRSTPARNRFRPENMPATSDGDSPSTRPRRNGW